MRTQFFLVIIFVLFSIETVVSMPHEADTINKNHLLLKTEILLPILTLIDVQNNTLIFGLSGEYKFNSKFSAQLSVYYLYNKDENDEYKGVMFMPEARYYLRNHFLGIYMQYMKENLENYTMYNTKSYKNFYAIGLLYGYQREFGNFIIEGFAGAGVSYIQFSKEKYKINDNYTQLNLLIGIQIGWKIF